MMANMMNGFETNRSRSEAIADPEPTRPVAVAGRWITLPSNAEAFKVGVGGDIQTVEARMAYRGAVIPLKQHTAMQARILERYADHGEVRGAYEPIEGGRA